ncbi:MAG: septum formation initiator family protein [Eggerthellaceae bacterium]|nr:septum formation initiator family protein [Eggerthellaceae bacterium]
MTNQARVLDYSDVRTSRKASARFGHSAYAAESRAAKKRAASSSSRSGRSARRHMPRGSISMMYARMEQVLHHRLTRKASRQFDRRGYGRTNETASSARAALHTGSMGSRQRRASRSYAQGSPYGHAAKAAIGGVFGGIAGAVSGFFSRGHSLKFYVLTSMVACLVLAGAFLYPAVQNYYIAVRSQAQAQAEYEALQDYYEQLQDDVALLSTDEGIKTRAHDKYGWVSPGENSVMVQGVQAESKFDGTDIGIVPSGSIKTPETWYSGILDPIFGYED